MTPRDRESLGRILECIEVVRVYAGRGGPNWSDDGMVLDAIAKRIEEIGEIAKRISAETIAAMPEVDWRGVRGIREILAHDYEDVEPDVLVDVVSSALPELHAAVVRVLKAGA
jgi:uncharacterized protein with HEPN domain